MAACVYKKYDIYLTHTHCFDTVSPCIMVASMYVVLLGDKELDEKSHL